MVKITLTLILSLLLVGCGTVGSIPQNASLTPGPSTTATPTLTFTPSAVAFGSVTVGSASTQHVTATNTGAVIAQLADAPAISGSADFRAASFTPGLVQPGSETKFDVVYSPQAQGSAAATLTLKTFGAAGQGFDLPLSGNGVPPPPPPPPAQSAAIIVSGVTDWGVVSVDSPYHEVQHIFYVTNVSSQAVWVNFSVDPWPFWFSYPSGTLEAGRTIPIGIYLKTYTPGDYRGTFTISYTGASPPVQVALQGKVIP